MGNKKTTSTKKPAAPKPAKKPKDKAPPALSKSDRAALLALDSSFEAPIDRSVATIIQEARDLESIAGKVGKQLVKKSKLDAKTVAALAPRRKLLDRAEAAWTHHRVATLPKDLKAARVEAESLKSDIIHALRHFLEEDAAVQRRVDAIIPGTGIADLVDDLKKLSDLVAENASALAKADLPKNAAKRARDFAEQLSGAAADRTLDPDGADAMALRNRAYWWLREAMDAIRSAGRYVFRNEPKMLAAFRATSTRAKARGSAGKEPSGKEPSGKDKSQRPDADQPPPSKSANGTSAAPASSP